MAYSYNNKKNGVYFFWDTDASAAPGYAASAFSSGHLTLFVMAGVAVGILGTTFVLLPKRKKEEGIG